MKLKEDYHHIDQNKKMKYKVSYYFIDQNEKLNTKLVITSLIMSLSSATVGFCPRLFITVPSSFVLIVPDHGFV